MPKLTGWLLLILSTVFAIEYFAKDSDLAMLSSIVCAGFASVLLDLQHIKKLLEDKNA